MEDNEHLKAVVPIVTLRVENVQSEECIWGLSGGGANKQMGPSTFCGGYGLLHNNSWKCTKNKKAFKAFKAKSPLYNCTIVILKPIIQINAEFNNLKQNLNLYSKRSEGNQ